MHADALEHVDQVGVGIDLVHSRRLYGSRNIATRRYDVKDDATQPFRVFWAN